ncbi:MAG: acyl dehydratase [Gammaproteobacteria bacterium]|jgi:acyl dehydratase
MARIVPPAELESLIGEKLEPMDWFEITQERVNDFADATLDHQFIHLDPEKAAQTPFGGTIAHGFLTLSLLSHLQPKDPVVVEGIVMGINYGFDKVRFLAPVRVGKRIRSHYVLAEVTAKSPTNFLFKYSITVEIEGEDKPALKAEWLAMQVISGS